MRPGEIDRDMSQRYLTLTANVEGEDMGRASRQVAQALAAAGEPPRGVRVETMGQLPPMDEMFESLGIGLGVAVFVIFVLLTAYFQSPRLALISIGAVPGVLAGIAIILYFTNTSLNIESFMGSIMCLGVSVSNSVMLVTFIDEHWKAGKPSAEAAIIGASERLRPILMTACAMTVGMVPMALALERGSQMQAPLGRAVIGGLVMSTFATLLVVPSIFAIVIGKKKARSPSIYPDDPESAHYDPNAYAGPAMPPSSLVRTESNSDLDPDRDPSISREPTMHRTSHPEPANSDGPETATTSATPEVPPHAWRFLMRHAVRPTIRIAPPPAAGSSALCWPPWRRRAAATSPRSNSRAPRSPRPCRLIQPQARNIVRVVGQPSFIESYERTSIYPKPTAYIQKWIVDIGDKVKKGDVLATLFAPELVEELGTKKATVVLDRERIALAKEVVEVAKADVEAAEARAQRGRGDPGQVRGRGRPLGHGGQAARAPGRPGRGRSPGPLRVDQSAQVEHRSAGQGEGDHQEGEGGTARRAGHARKGPGGRQGRRSRPEGGRERGEILRRPGWTISRSPPPSTA